MHLFGTFGMRHRGKDARQAYEQATQNYNAGLGFVEIWD
jgi:hypothetical protein